MLYLIAIVLALVLFCGPSLWVKYVLQKHSKTLPNMPGTGAELAVHLLRQYELNDVKVELTQPNQDHYSPDDNAVRLSPQHYEGKSLSAIAAAAHEVGHAIQFNRNEPVSKLRQRYMGTAVRIKRISSFLLAALPIAALVLKIPHLMGAALLVGVISMLISVLCYLAVLPEEWDASFNKALPILKEGEYVPEVYLASIKQILTACAITYAAKALIEVLLLWRWVRFIR